jgi:hypothetical protein
MGRRMSYSINFRMTLEGIPDLARQEIRRTMRQIADVVSAIPPETPLWTSIRHSLLQIDVKGWRLMYRVEPLSREILVIESAQIRPAP